MSDESSIEKMSEKGEGIKKYKLAILKSSHKDVKYSKRNIVNNIEKYVQCQTGTGLTRVIGL